MVIINFSKKQIKKFSKIHSNRNVKSNKKRNHKDTTALAWKGQLIFFGLACKDYMYHCYNVDVNTAFLKTNPVERRPIIVEIGADLNNRIISRNNIVSYESFSKILFCVSAVKKIVHQRSLYGLNESTSRWRKNFCRATSL